MNGNLLNHKVYLKKLALTNFRSACDVEITLHPRLNVFYGQNGSGKSTILDAAAVMFSWLIARVRNHRGSGNRIKKNDIANGSRESTIYVECQLGGTHRYWSLWERIKGKSPNGSRTDFTDLSKYARELSEMISSSEDKCNIPLFVYYPVNRSVLDIPLRIKNRYAFEILEAYDDALSRGVSFRRFFEWFRAREDLENEIQANQNRIHGLFNVAEPNSTYGNEYPDRQLKAVRDALTKLMPDFSQWSVYRSPLRMMVLKNKKPLNVSQLSDGEKCLMAMVGDLARRLAIANPMRKNPLEGEGVVLIDEIDLHLHPQWQHKIVPRLLDTFPNVQFLISTHSPHILTHVKPESLFVLKQRDDVLEVEKPNLSYGMAVDNILSSLMGVEDTRPDSVSNEFRVLTDLIDDGKLSEATKLISNMIDEIGNDPELVRAKLLIKRKELFKK